MMWPLTVGSGVPSASAIAVDTPRPSGVSASHHTQRRAVPGMHRALRLPASYAAASRARYSPVTRPARQLAATRSPYRQYCHSRVADNRVSGGWPRGPRQSPAMRRRPRGWSIDEESLAQLMR